MRRERLLRVFQNGRKDALPNGELDLLAQQCLVDVCIAAESFAIFDQLAAIDTQRIVRQQLFVDVR